MAGLLTFIRVAESDSNLVSLALGSDLTTLGLNLNSPEPLYNNFGGPWAENPCRPQDIDFHVPPEYLTNAVIREKLAPVKLNRYQEDLLFYLFYTNVGDTMQLLASHELYNRDWRYHKVAILNFLVNRISIDFFPGGKALDHSSSWHAADRKERELRTRHVLLLRSEQLAQGGQRDVRRVRAARGPAKGTADASHGAAVDGTARRVTHPLRKKRFKSLLHDVSKKDDFSGRLRLDGNQFVLFNASVLRSQVCVPSSSFVLIHARYLS